MFRKSSWRAKFGARRLRAVLEPWPTAALLIELSTALSLACSKVDERSPMEEATKVRCAWHLTDPLIGELFQLPLISVELFDKSKILAQTHTLVLNVSSNNRFSSLSKGADQGP